MSVYRALVSPTDITCSLGLGAYSLTMLYVLAMFSCLFGSCLADLDGAHGINGILAVFNNEANLKILSAKGINGA